MARDAAQIDGVDEQLVLRDAHRQEVGHVVVRDGVVVAAPGDEAVDAAEHHSDRGVHDAWADDRAVLGMHGIKRSMSRKGNCWDNAVAESFFASLKFELEDHAQWHDLHDVERDVAVTIDGFYNSERRHSHNCYQSPIDFEREFARPEIAT